MGAAGQAAESEDICHLEGRAEELFQKSEFAVEVTQ